MIKASELRPGNIIMTVDGIKAITGTLGEAIYWGGEMDFCASFRCQPISLTEEWLQKFGGEFKDYFGGYVFFIGPIALAVKGSDVWFGGLFLRKINYVHQLQNLYHALTAEELQIIGQNG